MASSYKKNKIKIPPPRRTSSEFNVRVKKEVVSPG
jgi:predicted HicB family RNase H-like nuclease